MKNLNNLLYSMLVSCFLINAQATTTMDSETQNLVIERLEKIIENMEPADSSYILSNTRLADLLAERARLRFMNEIEAQCQGCKGSVADRDKALNLYKMVYPKTKLALRGSILLQTAHLELIASRTEKSIGIYKSIINAKAGAYPEDVVLKARVSLADIYFEKLKYKEAYALYQKALTSPKLEQKAQIIYRSSWCEFNTNQLDKAIATLEKLAATENLPPGLQVDALQDLSVFYARQTITDAQIAKFIKLAPAENKKELLLSFAEESSRVGQKQASSQIYEIYLQDKNLSTEEILDANLLLSQSYYEQGRLEASLKKFEFVGKTCLSAGKCADIQKRMRHYVAELHRSKKSKLDNNLLSAYEIYIGAFIEDTQMSILGAQVAVDLKQNERASRLYAKAADYSKDPKLKEMSLAGEIETAEKSNQAQAKEKAYNHYLALMPQGSRSYEVRYQLAHLAYEQKQWKVAADKFHTLALEKTNEVDLKKKSADLALDCLAVEKRDEDIEKWSLEFAGAFPKSKVEFQTLYRKSVATQVVAVANKDNASSSELEKMIDKSQRADLTGASENEKILHFKNMMILATRAQNDKALNISVNTLIKFPSYTAEQREQTIAQTVGYYEKKANYSEAYAWAKNMKFPALKKSERELKLAALAEMAEQSSDKHYKAALAAGLPTNRMIAETVLVLFAKNQSTTGLEKYINNRKLSQEPAIRFIQKQPFYAQHIKFEEKISSHTLDTKSDRGLQNSIQARLNLLKEADRRLNQAVALKDFTAQIMALSSVQKENERFGADLMNTPMPQGLTPKEQAKYTGMLKQQTKPYAVKAKLAGQKLSSFWNQRNSIQDLVMDLSKSHKAVRPYIAQEIKLLTERAPNSAMKEFLEKSLSNARDLADNSEKMKISATKVSAIARNHKEKSL